MFLVRAPVFERAPRATSEASGDGIFKRLLQATRWPAATNGQPAQASQPPRLRTDSDASSLDTRKQILRANLQSAATLDEWRAAANELDELEGHNLWKCEVESSEYNFRAVEARLRDLDDARISCDAERMLFLIRTSLTRQLGGMGKRELYKRSHVGTKRLIERYIDSALETISSLLDITKAQGAGGLQSRHLLDQVLAARQSFGRSALLLSGGGTLGMNHIGVVKCLWETRLLPRIVSGSSAGSIVASVLCARTDEDLPATLEIFCYGELDVFSENGQGFTPLHDLARFLKIGALFDIGHLSRVMKNLLGDVTFQEAYNRTRRILNITVSSSGVFELPRLLNYVTAPNVVVWSAVAASCSVPVVFQAPPLLAKDPRTGKTKPWNPSPQRLIDGSVDGDLPMHRLAELFNVNHFIVSQVNPHVVPFIPKDILSNEPISSTKKSASGNIIPTLTALARDEALHRMQMLSELGIFPTFFTKTRSILSQRYLGDITIFPEVELSQFAKVLQNPTTEFMIRATICGEQATWPKLSRIQNHCAIELALDDAVQQLRARFAFSPSQTNLRLTAMSGRFAMSSPSAADIKADQAQRRKRLRTEPIGKPISPAQQPNTANSARSLASLRVTVPPTERRKPLPSPNQLAFDSADTAGEGETSEDAETEQNNFSSVTSAEESYGSDAGSEGQDYSSDDDDDNAISLRLWPSTTRQMFPSTSSPATPLVKFVSGPSYFSALTPRHRKSSVTLSSATTNPPSPDETFLSRSETVQGRRSEELPRRVRSSSSAASLPFELDLSGTRGMVLRKKQLNLALSSKTTPAAQTGPG